MPHQFKFLKKILKFLIKTDSLWALWCSLFFFKCLLVFMLPWPTCISFCWKILLTSNLLTASAFSFLLSPRGTIFEITTVLFSAFKDAALLTISSVISLVVLSRVRLSVYLHRHAVYRCLDQSLFSLL